MNPLQSGIPSHYYTASINSGQPLAASDSQPQHSHPPINLPAGPAAKQDDQSAAMGGNKPSTSSPLAAQLSRGSLTQALMHLNSLQARNTSSTNLHMSPSKLWSERLSEEAVEDLNHEMENCGLAHVAWGSKPAFFLEDESEGGCWQHFAGALHSGMKNGFALIPSANNSKAPETDHQGYLINVNNALNAISENKDIFTRRFGLGASTDPKQILQLHVFPLLADKTSADQEHEITAVLLGFGHEGAQAYAIKLGGNNEGLAEQNKRLDAYIEQRINNMSSKNEQGVMAPGIPSFIKLDTPGTRLKIDQYLGESEQIQKAQSELLNQFDNADYSDDEDDGFDRNREFASALMQRMCMDPTV